MMDSGDVVLFEFPRTDQQEGKLRPALVLTTTPGDYDDVWIVMISSQLDQAIEDFDEIISEGDLDFTNSGLKTESVVRISRVAVVERSMLEGQKSGVVSRSKIKDPKSNTEKRKCSGLIAFPENVQLRLSSYWRSSSN